MIDDVEKIVITAKIKYYIFFPSIIEDNAPLHSAHAESDRSITLNMITLRVGHFDGLSASLRVSGSTTLAYKY